jgi:hypothetical protein
MERETYLFDFELLSLDLDLSLGAGSLELLLLELLLLDEAMMEDGSVKIWRAICSRLPVTRTVTRPQLGLRKLHQCLRGGNAMP